MHTEIRAKNLLRLRNESVREVTKDSSLHFLPLPGDLSDEAHV